MPELIIILVLALVIFGAGKLPEIGTSLGKSIRAFKQAAEAPEPKPELPPQPAVEPDQPKEPTSNPEGGVPSPDKEPSGEPKA